MPLGTPGLETLGAALPRRMVSRRSVRCHRPGEVPQAVLERLSQAAAPAPSAHPGGVVIER